MESKSVVVCGPTKDFTKEKFEKYYKDRIDRLMQLKYRFLVGGAEGADKSSRDYLHSCGYQNVCVFDKGDQKNDDRFNHTNGFKSYPERDRIMVDLADIVIGFSDLPMGPGSGTMLNHLQKYLPYEDAVECQRVIRAGKPEDWEISVKVNFKDADKIISLIKAYLM